MKHILFVCTGNTCRSCMAEAIFRNAVSSDSALVGEFTVSSAGLAAVNGEKASVNSIAALQEEWGIDMEDHRARQISSRDIEEADLIFTMTRGHKQAIVSGFPQHRHKVFTLKEFAMAYENNEEAYNFALDIVDPYGMSPAVYKKCAGDIKKTVENVIKRLCKESQEM